MASNASSFRRGRKKTGGRVPGSVNKAIAAVRARVLADEALTVEATVEAIRRGQGYDIRQLYRQTGPRAGQLKELHELTEAEAWPIIAVDIVRENIKGGDGHSDTVVKYRLEGRRGYVELAAKHQGMLTEKIEVVGIEALVQRLASARQRVK